MSDDTTLLDLGIEDSAETAPATQEAMVPLSAVQKMIQEALAARLGEIAVDPADDFKPGNWPPDLSGKMRTIIIDDVEGLPNFEVIGLNGYVVQIKRNEEVEIPEEYVQILQHAVSAFEPTLGDVERGNRSVKNRSAIPWRLVR